MKNIFNKLFNIFLNLLVITAISIGPGYGGSGDFFSNDQLWCDRTGLTMLSIANNIANAVTTAFKISPTVGIHEWLSSHNTDNVEMTGDNPPPEFHRFLDLPQELQAFILDYLPVRTQQNCRLAARPLRDTIDQHSQWEIAIHSSKIFQDLNTPDDLCFLPIKHINFTGCAPHPVIRSMLLSKNNRVRGITLDILEYLTNNRTFGIDDFSKILFREYLEEFIKVIKDIPGLTLIDLKNFSDITFFDISDLIDTLAHSIKSNPSINSLKIETSFGFKEKFFLEKYFANNTRLKTLYIKGPIAVHLNNSLYNFDSIPLPLSLKALYLDGVWLPVKSATIQWVCDLINNHPSLTNIYLSTDYFFKLGNLGTLIKAVINRPGFQLDFIPRRAAYPIQ